MTESLEQIDAAADRIRDGLVGTLRELDRRRQQATDFRLQIDKHRPALIAVGAGAAVLLGAGMGIAALTRKARRRRRIQRRWAGLQRAWEHPERLATREDEAPVWTAAARKVALAFLVAFGTRLVKKTAVELLPVERARRDPSQPYT